VFELYDCTGTVCFNFRQDDSRYATNHGCLSSSGPCLCTCRSIYPATCNPFEDGSLGVATKCVINEVLRLVTNSTAGCDYTTAVSGPQSASTTLQKLVLFRLSLTFMQGLL
jgi:hypothetical protein